MLAVLPLPASLVHRIVWKIPHAQRVPLPLSCCRPTETGERCDERQAQRQSCFSCGSVLKSGAFINKSPGVQHEALLGFFFASCYVTPPGCGMPKSPLGRLLSKTPVDPIGREGLELAFAGSGSDRSLRSHRRAGSRPVTSPLAHTGEEGVLHPRPTRQKALIKIPTTRRFF